MALVKRGNSTYRYEKGKYLGKVSGPGRHPKGTPDHIKKGMDRYNEVRAKGHSHEHALQAGKAVAFAAKMVGIIRGTHGRNGERILNAPDMKNSFLSTRSKEIDATSQAALLRGKRSRTPEKAHALAIKHAPVGSPMYNHIRVAVGSGNSTRQALSSWKASVKFNRKNR